MFAALKEYSNYTRKLDLLTRLITNSDPQPLGGNELALFGTTISLTFNSGLGHFEKALDCMIQEVQELIERGEGILPKGSPKGLSFYAHVRTLGRRAVPGKGVACRLAAMTLSSSANSFRFILRTPIKWRRSSGTDIPTA
jgi:hypothetical protein